MRLEVRKNVGEFPETPTSFSTFGKIVSNASTTSVIENSTRLGVRSLCLGVKQPASRPPPCNINGDAKLNCFLKGTTAPEML